MIKKSIALSVIIILTLFLCQLNALTYFRVLVEGEISDTLVQGQSYSFEVGVDPLSTALFFFVEDLNNNSVIDPEETPLLPPYEHVKFQDNLYILPDSGAFYIDSDSTEGQIYIHDFFYILWVGNYILFCYDETDTFFQPFHVLPPDTVTMSVSGRIIFEGITPPNPLLSSFLLLGGIEVSEDPVVMLFNPDSFGDFSFNWLGDPGTVFLNFTGSDPILYEDIIYDIEDLNYEVYVDGHETGVEVWVRAYYPDTAVFHGYIVSSEGEPVTADSLFVVYPDGVGWCGYMDTFYVSAEDGYFGLNIVMDRCTHMQGYFDYYKVPHDFLTPFTGWYLAFSPEMSLEFEYNDTLFVINDSIWVSYTYERSTAPFEIDLPVKVNNYNYGYTNALVPYDSNLAIGIYWDDSIGADNPWYELTLDCEDCLPENYSLYGGRNYWVTAGDSIELVIGEMRSFISGTLFSAAGGRIFETTLLKLHQYSGYGSFSGSSYDIPIVDGIYENAPLFSDTLYWLEIDSIDGYMYSINDHRSFPSGHHTVNFSLYPTDAYFLLYLEIDSSDPMDDAFHVKLYSPEDDAMYSKRVVKNRWVSFPIYSGFDEPCRLLIANLAYGGFPPPLVRLVENNGNIPVEAGDSIRITMEVPIDYFIMEFVEDPADAWQHSLSTASLNICYYSREDTHLIYSYVPNYDSGMSLNLPIFSEPMLVRPESPFWFDLHYFIANPDEYLIVGGAYRPDHVTRYFNKGSGEMLLSLDGYPADYLGDDTIFLPRGDFSGVEIPEYPDHHYIADLFLFRTDMFHHPYGDGSVMAFHDVCDGEWTVVLPESLPGGFVPAVTETTFYVEDMSIYPDEWQEFPIAIPVKSPAGVHGYVNRELRFFEANLIQADFYVQGTDSLAVSARAWQYYPWGPPSILAKYYIKNTELPPNDYYLQLSFTGWTVEEPIIYPEQIEFSYTGDSLLLPDSYIAMTR
ncbi:hypothetical protein JXI42_14360, partial [bacterium]|nr:hypothetical protein [bacterium]